MFIVIFGKPNCPYCEVAKKNVEAFSSTKSDVVHRYIDIQKEGISKSDLERQAGKPVETVPQVFIDNNHIGGCDDLLAHLKSKYDFEPVQE